jgi:phosphatidylserine/phosphatidylglycerophosphate/cardiolipin synthase-like enzyme
VQGPALRSDNAKGPQHVALPDGTKITLWFAPNTKSKTKGPNLPPDLSDLFSRMRKAEKAILFAVFLPSRTGKNSIIGEAISLGQKDPDLLVYGAISDVTAMPNYVPPPHKKAGGDHDEAVEEPKKKKAQPTFFDRGNVHVVRAVALGIDDIVSDFEAEMLKVGHAIIHDKIIVVDPLSDKSFVAMGSHNLGYKASYENDENLLIVENNALLVQAYAVHVFDVYDHYRFRAVQRDLKDRGEQLWDGFLSKDDHWLREAMTPEKNAFPAYLAG